MQVTGTLQRQTHHLGRRRGRPGRQRAAPTRSPHRSLPTPPLTSPAHRRRPASGSRPSSFRRPAPRATAPWGLQPCCCCWGSASWKWAVGSGRNGLYGGGGRESALSRVSPGRSLAIGPLSRFETSTETYRLAGRTSSWSTHKGSRAGGRTQSTTTARKRAATDGRQSGHRHGCRERRPNGVGSPGERESRT